jgi:hypothetical protein
MIKWWFYLMPGADPNEEGKLREERRTNFDSSHNEWVPNRRRAEDEEI